MTSLDDLLRGGGGWSVTPSNFLVAPTNATTGTPRIVVGSGTAIPANLIAFYATFGYTVVSVILFYTADDDDYMYIAQLSTVFGEAVAIGSSIAGVISEQMFLQGVSGSGSAVYANDINYENELGSAVDGDWVDFTLQNGWTNRGGSFANSRYRRIVLHSLQVEFEITPGTTANGTALTTALPVRLRPQAIKGIPVGGRQLGTPGPSPVVEFGTDGVFRCYDVGGVNALVLTAIVALD